MSRNIGSIDQYVRMVVGLALVAFAFQDGRMALGRIGRVRLACGPPFSEAARPTARWGFQPLNAGLDALDPARTPDLLRPKPIERGRSSVLPPSFDQLGGVIEHPLAVL